MRFMEGNKSTLGLRGPDANAWKGGRRKDQDGRVWIFCPNHPRAVGGKYVFEHALVIEKAMGKLLPPRSVAHHVNGDESNNSNSNLVLCDS